jgi:hypothetical protein
MSHTTRTTIEICDSLSSLVDKIANIEIQMFVLCGENEDLKNQMAILNGLRTWRALQQNRVFLGHT